MSDPIKVMQNEMACVNRQITGCDRDCIKCDLVLEDSEIIAAYEAAIEALKLRTAKKVEINRYTDENVKWIYCLCPTCKTSVLWKRRFCQGCGQRLDWSEVEE